MVGRQVPPAVHELVAEATQGRALRVGATTVSFGLAVQAVATAVGPLRRTLGIWRLEVVTGQKETPADGPKA